MVTDSKTRINSSILTSSVFCPVEAYFKFTMPYDDGTRKKFKPQLRDEVNDIYSAMNAQEFEEKLFLLSNKKKGSSDEASGLIKRALSCRKYFYGLIDKFSVYHETRIEAPIGNFLVSGNTLRMFKEEDNLRRVLQIKVGKGPTSDVYSHLKLKSFIFMLKNKGIDSRGSLLDVRADKVSEIVLDREDEDKFENGLYMLETLLKNRPLVMSSKREVQFCEGATCRYKSLCHPYLTYLK